MDARRVADALNGWWPLRAGKPPEKWLGAPWPLIAGPRAGYPSRTESLCPAVPPVLYLGQGATPRWTDITADARRIAEHPHAANRPKLTLPDPKQTRFADKPTLRAHHAATLALTAYDTAALLESIALASGVRVRALKREAAAYRNTAERAEALLDVAASAFLEQAESAIAEAAISKSRPSANRIPSRSYRRVPINPEYLATE